MKKEQMCEYSEKRPGSQSDLKFRQREGLRSAIPEEVPKAQRVTCPTCGRRMQAWLSVGYDGDDIRHLVPPHKKKGWWKKRTRKKEKRMAPRGK